MRTPQDSDQTPSAAENSTENSTTPVAPAMPTIAALESPSLVPEISPDLVALRADAPKAGPRVSDAPQQAGAQGVDAAAPEDKSEASASAVHAVAVPGANRFAMFAACVALAAAIGAMIGSLTTAGFASLYAVPPAPQAAAVAPDDMKTMTKLLTQARAEIGALKAGIEASNKSAATQFARLGERFERVEKAQAEPAAKITAIGDTLTRVERKLVSADVTGSIGDKPAARAAEKPAQQAAQKMAVVEGWYVRDFYRGHAIVESARGGIFEVAQGSTLPGLGRVETIRQQNGEWVVVTPKGMILSMR